MATYKDFKVEYNHGGFTLTKPYGYDTCHVAYEQFGDEFDQTMTIKQAKDLHWALEKFLAEYQQAKG